MPSELDLWRQENASFEQNQTTNDTLESSLSTELLVTPPLPVHHLLKTKSLEDKEVDDDSLEACNFAESEYKKRIGNEISQKIEQGIIQEVVLFIQKEKLLTLSTNIPGTQDSNIEVNDDGDGRTHI
ncbi:5288_t:CDS:2 [Entrophospora sp. SA101]|nr:5288_t:CDS:2 [Entrophospora sp. SA101]